jgi:hypothetical protein
MSAVRPGIPVYNISAWIMIYKAIAGWIYTDQDAVQPVEDFVRNGRHGALAAAWNLWRVLSRR